MEVTLCLQNYGVSIKLGLESNGLGKVIGTVFKLVSYYIVDVFYQKMFAEMKQREKEES